MTSEKKGAGRRQALDSASRRSDAQKDRRNREAAEIIARRWAMARGRFEQVASVTFAELGRELGVSRQAVASRAAAEGWRKAADGGAIAQAANIAADRSTLPAGLKLDDPIPPHPTRPPRAEPPPDPLKPSGIPVDMSQDAANDAIRARADVLTRHRGEWRIIRGLMQEAIGKRDGERSKLALRMAQTLKIAQEGERKAWGLDIPESSTPPVVGQPTVTVRVLREGAPPAVTVTMGDDDDDE